MRRGDVYWVDLDPTIGGEIGKMRPAVIVTNDVAIRVLNRVQVIPLTLNTSRLYPGEAIVSVDGSTNKALADQIRTVSKIRIGRFIASLGAHDIDSVGTALKVQLDL